MKKLNTSQAVLIFAMSMLLLSGCGKEAEKEAEATDQTAPQIIVEVLTESTEAEETEPAPTETTATEYNEEKEIVLQLIRECHEAEIENNQEVLREKANLKEFIQITQGNKLSEDELNSLLYSENSLHSDYPMLKPKGYGEPAPCTEEEVEAMNGYIQILYNSAEHEQGAVNPYIVTKAYRVPVEYEDDNDNTVKEYEAYIYALEANGEWKYDMWVSLTAFVLNSYTNGEAIKN